MIDIISTRNNIISGLYNYINVPVILLNQAKPKSKNENKIQYPFVGYKITTPYNSEGGQDVVTVSDIPNSDEVELTRSEQPTITISLTAYSTDEDEALQTALECRKWFEFIGEDYLKENDIVVVNLTSVQNREALIAGDFEKRIGFDIIIRVTSKIKRIVTTIDSTDIQKGE